MEKEKDVWSFKTSDLVTIPNIITYVRFVLIIPFVYFFLAEQYIYAAICIGLSGLSDCFDGMAARKLNQVTPLGKILDPIADKVTLFAVVICMVIYVPMVLPILVTLLVKDLLMLLGGADLIKKRLTPPSANWYGKVGTIIQKAQDAGKKSKEKKAETVAETPAPVVAAPVAPAQIDGVSDEVVAVISAAVATMYGSSEKARIKSIKKSSDGGRSAWAKAGVLDNTRPV